MPAAARGAAAADINSCSIGIEIVNPGHAYGYPDFLDAPDRGGDRALPRHRRAPLDPCPSACWPIPTWRPAARSIPARNFRGRGSHAAGVGHYVEPAPIRGGRFLTAGERGEPVEALQSMLALYGYGVEITGMFDPATDGGGRRVSSGISGRARVDGVADRSTIETLHRLLAALPPDVA